MSIDFEFAPSFGSTFSPKQGLPLFLKKLNEPQREAAMHVDGPLIVLAGAGSGKTRMLTSRIAYLMGYCGVAPYNILAVTFTNKAAREMQERVEQEQMQMADEGGRVPLGRPEIGTFHSVCVKILRREADKTPFAKPFVIFDDSDQLTLIKSVMKRLDIDPKSFSPKSFQAAINRAKCDCLEPQDLTPSSFSPFEKWLQKVYEEYQKELFANQALDFGEILCMTYRLFRDHPDVRQNYQRRFRYVHVDEYQDTNRAQYLLLSTLVGAPYGGHQNICVVGDEDQSIYKWRGADIRNILDFEKDFPGAKTVKLEQNYRSTKTIITAASELIQNNRERKNKKLWTQNEDGSSILRLQFPDERTEAETVIRQIKTLAGEEGRAFYDFAIFYRTHAQSRQFEDALRREKISYQIYGGLRFYDRKEIKDILSFFRVILNPADSVSLKRIINIPARGLGKATLDKLDDLLTAQMQAAPTNLWSVIENAACSGEPFSGRVTQKLAGFVALVRKLITHQPSFLLSELYHLILDETGYVQELRKEGTVEALSRIENLEEFDTLLQEFEEDYLETIEPENQDQARKDLLAQFIEQSSLASEGDGEKDLSGVKMMTLHASKGLEFPVVYMVGMEEGLFPSTKPWEETPAEEIEEERRLCYVGMTRARQRLVLTHAVVRRIWGTFSYQEPARFFAEIPEEWVEFQDLSASHYVMRRQSTYPDDPAAKKKFYQVDPPRTEMQFSRNRASSVTAFLDSEQDASDQWVGEKFEHPEYGAGVVIASEGAGKSQKLTVEFKGRVKRKFLLEYLKKLMGED